VTPDPASPARTPGAFAYRNRTAHVRYAPFKRAFSYELYQLFLDIDRLDETAAGLRLLAVDRPGVFGFRRADHGPKDGSPLRPWAEELWRQAGVELEGGKIWLLCFPRMLGYVFNPLSVWFGYGPNGDWRGVIYEVRNTFGESHVYIAKASPDHAATKAFHVSPFFAVEGDYHFAVREPGERFALRVENRVEGDLRHLATLAGERTALTDAGLLKVLVGMPFMTLGVTAAIHWEALWIWLKGGRYHKKPPPPDHPASAAHGASDISSSSTPLSVNS
jgi:hypothetical protein